MSVTLESLATCFQGLVPAQLFTCSLDGVPNAAYLSHVEYVDAQHVALSFQFFNKSRRNIAENPQALVMLPDPDTGQSWLLRLRFVRSETSGALFERMALRIEAIASYCGLKGIFKLRAADVYEVLAIDPAPEEVAANPERGIDREAAALLDAVFTTKGLQDLATLINRADTLEALVDAILRGLDESFGFKYSALLVPTEEPGVLDRLIKSQILLSKATDAEKAKAKKDATDGLQQAKTNAPSEEAFNAFRDDPELADLHPLRENGTKAATGGVTPGSVMARDLSFS